MLEARGIRRVAGNGHIDTLPVHDGNAFTHIVSAIAANSGALAFLIGKTANEKANGTSQLRKPKASARFQ